ncbi:SMODS domain-containing nucleotidyltransferase [Streptomyces adonidis]|uniref:SMODS domain-containing nucleotidyltransferase n=1 Tax=Streptomyces adonidis TaxID=3231367 RepID=UPI0034DB7305
MAVTTTYAFEQFNLAVTPSEATKEKINQRKNAVEATLRAAFPSGSDIQFQSSKIIGSLGRNTAGNPVSDIDLMVHLHVDTDLWNRRYRQNSADFLYRVRSSLNSTSTVQKIGARGQAVRLFYQDGLYVDVAPVEKYTSGAYGIPDGSGGWLTTDPVKHETFLNEKNATLSGDLKRVIRFAKQWNSAHGSRIGSFHLEMLVARTYGTLTTDSRDALRLFFSHNRNNLSVIDPAGHSGDLSSSLTWSARADINNSLATALNRADLAIQAERRGDHREAIRLWGIILGSRFPIYG